MRPQKQTNTRYGDMFYFAEDPTIGRSLELYGEYCHNEVEIVKQLANPNGVLVDVGANIGTHTIGLAPHVARVLCFEPDPEIHKLLVQNIAISKHKNITAVPLALSDMQSQVGTQFDYGKTMTTSTGNIHATPLDMIDGLPSIDFIKIDVEGSELKVLNGMRQTIATSKPNMLIEMQDVTTYADTFELLQGFDYYIYWFTVATYNISNHKQNKEDVFGPQHGVINWICSREKLNTTLQAVVDRNDTVERMVWRRNQNVGDDIKHGE